MIRRLIIVAIIFAITTSNYLMAITVVEPKTGYKVLARTMFLESACPIAIMAAIFS